MSVRRNQRIKDVAEAEEAAYAEALDREWEQRDRGEKERARAAGFQEARYGDPMIPYVCPACGASVSLTGVDRHIAWHETHA